MAQEKFKKDFQAMAATLDFRSELLKLFFINKSPRISSQHAFRLRRNNSKYIFLSWQLWWPSLISDWNDFSYSWPTSHPNTSYKVSGHLAFPSRRSSKYTFKMVAILDFRLERFFLSAIHSNNSYQVSSQLTFRFIIRGSSKQIFFLYFALVAILCIWLKIF